MELFLQFRSLFNKGPSRAKHICAVLFIPVLIMGYLRQKLRPALWVKVVLRLINPCHKTLHVQGVFSLSDAPVLCWSDHSTELQRKIFSVSSFMDKCTFPLFFSPFIDQTEGCI